MLQLQLIICVGGVRGAVRTLYLTAPQWQLADCHVFSGVGGVVVMVAISLGLGRGGGEFCYGSFAVYVGKVK